MAAAAAPIQNLQEEATCSICLEYFDKPVFIDCGHNFCRACITKCWERRERNFPCPQCRAISVRRNFRPNRQLGNVVEIAKQLQRSSPKPQGKNICEKHEERLKLFCENDLKMICLVCRESTEHKTHSTSPIDEAAEEYKGKLQDWLCSLKKETEYISKLKEEEQYKTMKNILRDEKKKIASEVGHLRQLLKEKEKTIQGRLEEMEKNITKVENANITKLSNQINSLNVLITEIEKKCKESVWDLLKDIKSTLSRCNAVKFQGPEPEIKKIMAKVNHNKRAKIEEPEENMKSYKVMVTLDPGTAHPRLLLFEGQRRAREKGAAQRLAENPKRFTFWSCVLGSEGFTSGRHYWEVQLLQEGLQWHVGVAAESVNRKGYFIRSPETGIWAVQRWKDQYLALTSPVTYLSVREKPRKLGVYLDYEGRCLSLYNADSKELLYTFHEAPFARKLFPYFGLWGGAELRLV
ncbi:E3 ubiquitin-protein ligase TRIM39-like [Lissotriton helveticus]